MKGIKKALCLLVLLFSVALALPVTANASTNGHTAQEALAWAKAQVGKSLDYDGVYGAQCVDRRLSRVNAQKAKIFFMRPE